MGADDDKIKIMTNSKPESTHSLKIKQPYPPNQPRKNKALQATISRLSQENARQKTIIDYQRNEINLLAHRASELEKKLFSASSSNAAEGNYEDTSLLSLLEAIEEMPAKRGKNRFHRFLIDAFLNKNSRYYPIVNNFLVGLIFFSVICVTLESVPGLEEKWAAFFHWSEMVVVALFTIEYIINIYVAEDKLAYIFSIWGLIDLVAILPTYFYLVDLRDIKLARTLRIVRCLRTLRIMRILKLSKTLNQNIHRSVTRRVNTLLIDLQIYATALFAVIIIFSTLVYYAERGMEGTQFSSIPASMWWCLVTITTVGYGDMHPITFIGKLIASAVMIIGLALFGILMNVIGKAMITSLFGSSKAN